MDRDVSGSIGGRIVDADGAPIREATVMIAEGPTHPDLAALTGDDGSFRFTNLLPGRYELLVNAEGREPRTVAVAVHAGEDVRRDLRIG